jgi:aspartyl protease family protein
MAEAALHLNNDALQSYATMISLTRDQPKLGEWVFNEMANLYASSGQYCEAMSTISTFISLDPQDRETSRNHELISSFGRKGACSNFSSGSERLPIIGSDVIYVQAEINGVSGTFIVDTGASFVSTTAEFAERAGLEGKGTTRTSTANGEADARLSKASSVRLGHLRANDVPVMILSKSLGKADGLLGRSFLSRFDMSMNSRELTLRAK